MKHANVCRAGTCSPKYLNPGAWELGLQVNPRPITCPRKAKRKEKAPDNAGRHTLTSETLKLKPSTLRFRASILRT